jgi:hypothetical protein
MCVRTTIGSLRASSRAEETKVLHPGRLRRSAAAAEMTPAPQFIILRAVANREMFKVGTAIA